MDYLKIVSNEPGRFGFRMFHAVGSIELSKDAGCELEIILLATLTLVQFFHLLSHEHAVTFPASQGCEHTAITWREILRNQTSPA
jgi:hypothetical protein